MDEARKEIASTGAGTAARIALDIDERRYDTALEELRRRPEFRSATPLWLTFVTLLETSGQRDESFREGTALVTRFPSCEVRAVVAGLRLEHGQKAAAHRLADPIL